MKVARATLFLLIGAGRVRMRAQIIPEGDVTLDLRRIRAEEVKLHDANAGRIGKRTIAPSGYAEFAVPMVAERLDAPAFSVKLGQVGYERHQIDDRLSQPDPAPT